MSDSTVFVGLDYHDRSVQVCIMSPNGQMVRNRAAANDWHEIASAVGPDVQVQAAIEACTGSADLAEQLVEHAGWSVSLAHARYVARLKQSPDKSDYSDGRLLADLTRVGYLPRVWLPPAPVRELRKVVSYREHLVEAHRRAKQRITAVLRDLRAERCQGRRWTKAWLQWLEELQLPESSRWIIHQHLDELADLKKRLAAVQQRLLKLADDDAMTQRLLNLRGVGIVTASVLRAAIGRFDRFRTGKQLSRFCGLSPRNVSSGEKQHDGGLINDANKQLRRVLIELAWRLIRYESRWKELAASMRRRGKAGSVIAAAVANRWTRWLYHQMQTGTN